MFNISENLILIMYSIYFRIYHNKCNFRDSLFLVPKIVFSKYFMVANSIYY